MGRKTYQGGSTILRFSHLARSAMRLTGPNRAEGEANVKRAQQKRIERVLERIRKTDEERAAKMARRRRERQ